jgi:hypothetical protein
LSCKKCSKGPSELYDVGCPSTGTYELPKELQAVDNFKNRKKLSVCNVESIFEKSDIPNMQGLSYIMTKSEAEIMGIYGTRLLNLDQLNEYTIESGQSALYERLKKALAW